MDFQVWDFPGQVDFTSPTFDFDSIFSDVGALVWVIDAQDEYIEAVSHLEDTYLALRERGFNNISFQVFVHKVDGLSDDFREDIQRDVDQRVRDDLSDLHIENPAIDFYLTSIYDHSVFEAFSKVIQTMVPQLPTLENLLNELCRHCRFEKAYLFDVLTKIYIAQDSSPGSMDNYEICSDYIDVIVDMSQVYGWDRHDRVIQDKKDDELGSPDAESVIILQNDGKPLYLREINR
jgi:Ras-related GTP-binding protein C/D